MYIELAVENAESHKNITNNYNVIFIKIHLTKEI